MPIVAEASDGSVVTAFEVEKADGTYCPDCGDKFDHIRSRHVRDGSTVSECFVHDSGGSGSCGESDQHKKMKGIAAAAADNKYESARVEFEKRIGSKQADVLVEFQDGRFPLASGIGIEVQYKNKSKDIEKTQNEYAENGYSTIWLYPEHFNGYSVDLSSGTLVTAYSEIMPETAYQGGPKKYEYEIGWSKEATIPTFPKCVKEELKMVWSAGKQARENTSMRERKKWRRSNYPDSPSASEDNWHETRFEGWDISSAPSGKVRRFSTTRYQWETIPLEIIPDHIIERRSPESGGGPD